MEVLQPLDGLGAYHVTVGQELQVRFVQVEMFQRIQNAAGAGHHAIATAFGQATREHLEHALAVGGTVFQGGVEHRVFIHVGHQSRRIIDHCKAFPT